MNLEQVAQFVKKPQELGLSHAESLKNLSEKHPYTSIYPLLYLTALSNGKSPDLDEALQQYAYKISDRTRLYHLLQGEKDNIVTTGDDLTEDSTERIETSSSPILLRRESPESVQPDDTEAVTTDEGGSEEDQNPELIPSQPSEITSLPENIPTPESDAEAIQRKTEAEIGFDFEKVTTAHSLEQYLEVEEITTEEMTQELPDEALPVKEEFKSFSSWLRSGDSQGEKAVDPVVKPKPNDLIEKFIQEEPSISRSKKEFYSPSRKAKESLNEDAVPVSETLAKIYAAQGNYPKAIHVYHQLMLSIPEKKSFFAIQIEELKQKITS